MTGEALSSDDVWRMTMETLPPKYVPGAMQEYITRDLGDRGLIEFEFAPRGWRTRNGEPRKTDWRAYFHTPPGGKRERLISVTTLLGEILPKDALVAWAEAKGIEGAVRAVRAGWITDETPLPDVVKVVRDAKLGADAARDEAATRGVNVHALLEDYMRTGSAPDLAEHPVEHHGYIQALCGWLLARNPEPESVEDLVAYPGRYAGRRDLVARCSGVRIGYDAKTQRKAAIYISAHLQVRMYDLAAVVCGDRPCDELRVVVFSEDGQWREMPCEASIDMVQLALQYHQAISPINRLCDSHNRSESEARR